MVQKLLMCAGGFAGGSASYTTPGTYYWYAPLGATAVDVTGRGGSSGTAQSWTSTGSYKYMVGGIFINHPSGGVYNSSGSSLGSSLSYATARSIGNGYLSQWNSVTTSSGGAYYSGLTYFYFNYDSTAGTWYRWPNFTYNGIYRRTGSLTAVGQLTTASGTIPTSGYVSKNMYPNNIQRGTTSTVSGGNSTAFNQTFNAGGSQTTVTNLSVTGGTTYTIFVGADQGSDTAFISFDYY